MVLKTTFYLLIGLLILSLGACSSFAGIPITGGDQTLGAESGLANTRWKLAFYGQAGSETTVLDGTEVTLQFEHGNQAGGFTGCNTFSAEYAVSNSNRLSITEVASNGLPCGDESSVDQEKRVLDALRAAESFELRGESLIIHYRNGVLSFWKVTAPHPNSVHI